LAVRVRLEAQNMVPKEKKEEIEISEEIIDILLTELDEIEVFEIPVEENSTFSDDWDNLHGDTIYFG
jgi:hypothetical protein